MDEARRILKDIFGYYDFKLDQAAIIKTLLDGGDALALMPTGGGKSLCFQIPALIREGTGIVISPLIALMQDQVEALKQLGIRAAYLNSMLDRAAAIRTEEALERGELDLLYLAPERLAAGSMLAQLKFAKIALFAIDEAHCVSQWGHDFRPEYRRLNVLHEMFPKIPRIALTATADERTRKEIISELALDEAQQFISSFDRPNIRYAIDGSQGGRNVLWKFLEREHAHDSGIVYCLSRSKTEDIAQWLSEKGRTALPYHAGLNRDMRQSHQERFLREEGIIIVATIAFGMGIDKPDVRFVAHLNLPKTIEAYYQETGRAGRDGAPANAWMSYSMKDVVQLRLWQQQSTAGDSYKRVQHQKLEALLGFCELGSCRRQTLLAYFGEQMSEPCGNCDNCLDPPETIEGTELAQKALSCVYRTGQMFGVTYLVDVLRGKENERITRFMHDKLPTFGIGADIQAVEWRGIFRQLLGQGLLTGDEAGHGGLVLTEKSWPVLRGEAQVDLRKHKRPAAKKKEKKPPIPLNISDQDKELFEELRGLRLKLATEQNIPPYVVFHDRALIEMINDRPKTLDDMLNVSGIGEAKLERYGQIFLDALREHEQAEE